MATWTITQTVEYYAEGIEADTKAEAMDQYLSNQEMYYSEVVEERIEVTEKEESE